MISWKRLEGTERLAIWRTCFRDNCISLGTAAAKPVSPPSPQLI